MGFTEGSISPLKKIEKSFYANQNVEDGTNQISVKINEKCWSNFKLCSPSRLKTGHFYTGAMSQVLNKHMKK